MDPFKTILILLYIYYCLHENLLLLGHFLESISVVQYLNSIWCRKVMKTVQNTTNKVVVINQDNTEQRLTSMHLAAYAH